jgi:tRNA-specific 2-thiouridylase
MKVNVFHNWATKDLGIGGIKDKSDQPWYVAKKRTWKITALVVVQGREHPILWTKKVFVEKVRWLNSELREILETKKSFRCLAKTVIVNRT